MLAKSGIDIRKRMQSLGGNPQVNVRLNAEWQERLEALAREDEGAATLIKDWLYPLLAQIVTIERSDAGKVLSITGLDADGKKVTLRCDGPPVVKRAKPLGDSQQRGRPKKA